MGLHVQHLGDSALHDQEVRVVNVELHGVEQVLHPRRLRGLAVNHVLVPSSDDDLARHRDLVAVLVPDGRTSAIRVVEHDGDGGFRHARLALLVHELLQRGRANLVSSLLLTCDTRERREMRARGVRIDVSGWASATT